MEQPTHFPNILAIETATSQASVSLYAHGKNLFTQTWTAERSHNSKIFDVLAPYQTLLQQNSPDLILVGSGPGSYSGVRVALAVADGLALIYNAQVITLPSWEALPHQGQDCLIFSDARRNGWAYTKLHQGHMTNGLTIVSSEEMKKLIDLAYETNTPCLTCETKERITATNGMFSMTHIQTDLAPQAERLISNWLAKTPEQQKTLKQTPASPLYVREPNITPAKRTLWQKGLH